MKTLKNVLVALVVSLSLGTFSTQVIAVGPPAVAIENVQKQIKATQDAIASGAEGDAVYQMVRKALDLSKEINASDKVSAYRSRANSHLKKARGAAKKEELQPAEEHLKKAAEAFQRMRNML